MLTVSSLITQAAEYGASLTKPQAKRLIDPDQEKAAFQPPRNADGTSSNVTSARKEGERLDLNPAAQQAPSSDTLLGVSTYNSFGRSTLLGGTSGGAMSVFA